MKRFYQHSLKVMERTEAKEKAVCTKQCFSKKGGSINEHVEK